MRVGAILRVLEPQVSRTMLDEEADHIKEAIRKALQWVACGKEEDQPKWIVPPSTEEETTKEALAGARRFVEEAKQTVSEVEEAHEGQRHGEWRGLRRGRSRQMQFLVQDKEREGQPD